MQQEGKDDSDGLRPLVRQGGHKGLSEGQRGNTDPKEVRESHEDIEGAEWAGLRGQPA